MSTARRQSRPSARRRPPVPTANRTARGAGPVPAPSAFRRAGPRPSRSRQVRSIPRSPPRACTRRVRRSVDARWSPAAVVSEPQRRSGDHVVSEDDCDAQKCKPGEGSQRTPFAGREHARRSDHHQCAGPLPPGGLVPVYYSVNTPKIRGIRASEMMGAERDQQDDRDRDADKPQDDGTHRDSPSGPLGAENRRTARTVPRQESRVRGV